MPARTNEFQEMVALLTTVMREDDSMTVTPSAMLPDIVTGTLREVDICVETQVVGNKVVVGIECRDHKRPQTVAWVEETHTKHEALQVNFTILVSSSGFSEEAVLKAAHYGMRTVTPGEVTPGFVGTVVNNLDKITTKRAHFRVQAVKLKVRLGDGHEAWLDPFVDTPLTTQDGIDVADVAEVVKGMLTDNPKQREHLQTATDDDKFMIILTNGPTAKDGTPLYVSVGTKDGEELPPAAVIGMHISGPVTLDFIDVPLKHGDYNGTPFSSGSVPFEGMRISVVATEGDDGTVTWAGSTTKPGGGQEFFRPA